MDIQLSCNSGPIVTSRKHWHADLQIDTPSSLIHANQTIRCINPKTTLCSLILTRIQSIYLFICPSFHLSIPPLTNPQPMSDKALISQLTDQVWRGNWLVCVFVSYTQKAAEEIFFKTIKEIKKDLMERNDWEGRQIEDETIITCSFGRDNQKNLPVHFDASKPWNTREIIINNDLLGYVCSCGCE